jgi:ABC-type multidrug transport system ATPase subunit
VPGVSSIERIDARGISRRYGTMLALRPSDVAFQAGEIVTIEGPNGSGKSTLLGLIGSWIRPSSGQIVYLPGAVDLSAVRSQIGWVAHETLAYPDLTTRQNLRLACALYGVDPVAAWRRLAERFGLTGFADRPLRQQSRGQRQRLALAKALVHRPSVLLFDEPTSGLDPQGVEHLCGVLRQEAGAGRIVVMVTHDTLLAESLGTRRVRLDRGRIL